MRCTYVNVEPSLHVPEDAPEQDILAVLSIG